MSKILVLGLPKSATTAMYIKLKHSFPKHAHLMEYHEDGYKDVVCKLLIPVDSKIVETYDKVVLMVRDPRDRLVSSTLYAALRLANKEKQFYKFMEKLLQKEANPLSVSLHELGMPFRKSSHPIHIHNFGEELEGVNQYQKIKEAQSNFKLVRYEDFIKGDHGLTSFLGKISKTEPAWEVGSVAREKSSGGWRNWFTPKDVTTFKPWFNKFMETFGYEDDWTLFERPVINSSKSSKYVLRIVNEWREGEGLAPFRI